MLTVPFKSVLYGAASKLGLAPYNEAGISKDKGYELANSLNDRVSHGWKKDWWPDLMVIEERALVTDGTTDVTYAPFTAADKTPIGEVLRCYKSHPLTTNNPYPLSHNTMSYGVVPSLDASDSIFISFRLRVPAFTTEDYDSTRTYAVDEVTYCEGNNGPVDGDCYICILEAKGKQPDTSSTYWTKIDFPAFLKPFVVLGVYADCLDDEDQETTRWKASQTAEDKLIEIVDEIMGAQGSSDRVIAEVG